MQALNLPAWLWGIHLAPMPVKYIEFSPSTYVLHVENRILFVYEISSQWNSFFFLTYFAISLALSIQRSQSTLNNLKLSEHISQEINSILTLQTEEKCKANRSYVTCSSTRKQQPRTAYFFFYRREVIFKEQASSFHEQLE